jgi:hypothetical protein
MDWIDKVFSSEEYEELLNIGNSIIYNNENGFVAHLALSNEQCIDLIAHYRKSRNASGEARIIWESMLHIENFLSYFMQFLEEYLLEDGFDINGESSI